VRGVRDSDEQDFWSVLTGWQNDPVRWHFCCLSTLETMPLLWRCDNGCCRLATNINNTRIHSQLH